MQLTIDRDAEQRRFDIFFVVMHSFFLVFAAVLIAFAIASPSIAIETGDWMGVPFAIALGVAGYVLGKMSAKVVGGAVGTGIARWAARRAGRKLAAELLGRTLTARPMVFTFVRVLEPTWTTFGVIHPSDVGVVLAWEVDEEELVSVRWRIGESIHDYRYLAADA